MTTNNYLYDVNDVASWFMPELDGPANWYEEEYSSPPNGGVFNTGVNPGAYSITGDAPNLIYWKPLKRTIIVNSQQLSPSASPTYLSLGGNANSFVTATANEVLIQLKIPVNGTLQRLQVGVLTNTKTANVTVATRINQAAGSQLVTIPAGQIGWFSDKTNQDTVNAGDLVDYQINFGATGSVNLFCFMIEFSPASGKPAAIYQSYWAGSLNTSSGTNAGKMFNPLTGGSRSASFHGQTASNTLSKQQIYSPATFSNVRVYCSAFSTNINPTLHLYKNGSDTGVGVTITGTGVVEDTVNTVHVANGDFVEWVLDLTGRTSGSVTIQCVQCSAVMDGNSWDYFSAVGETDSGLSGLSNAGNFFTMLQNTYLGYGTTQQQFPSDYAPWTYQASFSNMTLSGSAGSPVGSTTVKFYKNGADGNQSISYTSTIASQQHDSTHTDTADDGDLLSLHMVPNATTADLTVLSMQVTLPQLYTDVGAYAVTGAAPKLLYDRVLNCNAGAYSITGASPALQTTLGEDVGVYTITGAPADLVIANTSPVLNADPGVYTISGGAPAIFYDRILGAAAGSYSVNGRDPALFYGRVLKGSPGSYLITGDAAALLWDRLLKETAGSYAISGVSPSLATTILAPRGQYLISGANAALLFDRVLKGGTGAYSVTGDNPAIIRGRHLKTDIGTYSVTGEAAAVLLDRLLKFGSGVYTFTGDDALLRISQTLKADPGVYQLTGFDPAIFHGFNIKPDAGVYAITGRDAAIIYPRQFRVPAGTYTLDGIDPGLFRGVSFLIVPGEYKITGTKKLILVHREHPQQINENSSDADIIDQLEKAEDDNRNNILPTHLPTIDDDGGVGE